MQKHLFAGTALLLALICQPAMAQDAGAAGSDTGDRAAEQRPGGLLAPVLGSGIFWLGVAIPFAIGAVNGLHSYSGLG